MKFTQLMLLVAGLNQVSTVPGRPLTKDVVVINGVETVPSVSFKVEISFAEAPSSVVKGSLKPGLSAMMKVISVVNSQPSAEFDLKLTLSNDADFVAMAITMDGKTLSQKLKLESGQVVKLLEDEETGKPSIVIFNGEGHLVSTTLLDKPWSALIDHVFSFDLKKGTSVASLRRTSRIG